MKIKYNLFIVVFVVLNVFTVEKSYSNECIKTYKVYEKSIENNKISKDILINVCIHKTDNYNPIFGFTRDTAEEKLSFNAIKVVKEEVEKDNFFLKQDFIFRLMAITGSTTKALKKIYDPLLETMREYNLSPKDMEESFEKMDISTTLLKTNEISLEEFTLFILIKIITPELRKYNYYREKDIYTKTLYLFLLLKEIMNKKETYNEILEYYKKSSKTENYAEEEKLINEFSEKIKDIFYQIFADLTKKVMDSERKNVN